jgi:hypothetical protein
MIHCAAYAGDTNILIRATQCGIEQSCSSGAAVLRGAAPSHQAENSAEKKTRNIVNWNRSELLALTNEDCTSCGGCGFRPNSVEPCHCALRAIFRACHARFKYCATSSGPGAVRLEPISHAVNGPRVFGRKNSEFMADFELIARRTLTIQENQLFRFHFLLGADWRLCCRRLKMARGAFFHAVYRIESKLGRAFRETEPYGIFPLDEYFGGTVCVKAKRIRIVSREPAKALRPPLRAVPLAA